METKTYKDIPGWFRRIDYLMFTSFLASQEEPGDLVEIGVFMGKSAVVIDEYVRPGEKFVAIDIFGDQSLLGDADEDAENAAENRKYYPRLTRDRFEEHFLSVRPSLPTVVQANSTEVVKYVEPGAARFIHVDASHLYAGVAADARSVKQLLRPGGVVSFDDWRNAKCPGVAAAVWEAVIRDGMIPVATTRNKLYGVYSGAEEALAVVRALVADKPDFFISEDHEIMGHTVVRLESKRELAELAAKKRATTTAPTAEPAKRKWLRR
jgi:SAM-dependent methyltransferase